MEIEPLHIYRLPDGTEVVALEHKKGRIFFFTEEEFAEEAQAHYVWDEKIQCMRYSPDTSDVEHWTIWTRLRDMQDTGREVVECDSCGASVWEPHICPDIYDDQMWEMMALEHEEDCEWIMTRAFRL